MHGSGRATLRSGGFQLAECSSSPDLYPKYVRMQAPSAQAFTADANGVLQKIGSNLDILSLASAEHRVIDLQGKHVVPVSNSLLQILPHMPPNVCLTGSWIVYD